MKKTFLAGAGAGAAAVLIWGATTSFGRQAEACSRPATRPSCSTFEDLRIHLEVDLPARGSTGPGRLASAASLLDLPAEVVLEANSAAGFARIRLLDSSRRTVLHLDCSDVMTLGVSELALETEGVTLADALREYPPGTYRVEAATIDGRLLAGAVELSARFPGPFTVLAPRPGETLTTEDVTITWTTSRGARNYILEVEQDELGFVFETRLPPWQTSFTIPRQVLQPGETYDYSLVVQGDTDNELEVEGGFVTPGPKYARRAR